MKQFTYFSALALMGGFLVGCAVGPDFSPPVMPPIKAYTPDTLPAKTVSTPGHGGESQHFLPGELVPYAWWTRFSSPELNALVERGFANSPTVAAAQAALVQAKQNWRAGVGSAFFPTVGLTVTDQRLKFSNAGFGDTGASNSVFSLYDTAVPVSYVLDVFGGERRTVEALGALVNYQQYQLEGTYLTLAANIVITAVAEASLRAQIASTEAIIVLEQNQLTLTKKQLALGAVTRTEVLSQQTLLAQTKATLPPLQQSLVQTRNNLATLVGELPSESHLPVMSLKNLHLPTQIPLSIPSELVRQRPDIRAAEALLHQASAQIGVATANLFPQITITGSYGTESDGIATLFAAQSIIWNLTGQAAQTLFNGGALIAQRKAAIAAYNQSLALYQQSVLQGFRNVADALHALKFDALTLQAQTIAEKSAADTLTMTQLQYKLGAVNYLYLLNAERQLQQTQIARIQAEASRYADTAALFQALGGGQFTKVITPSSKEGHP